MSGRAARTFAAVSIAACALAAGGSPPGDAAAVAPVGTARTCPPRPVYTGRPVSRPRWLSGAIVTEYFPVRERWFAGRLVRASGLPGRHRVDWLYGPHGVAMNGVGIGTDGRRYRFAGPYDLSWVNARGARTLPCWNGHWTGGKPAWLEFGWRNARGAVTFPLRRGGWSNGRARDYVPPRKAPVFGHGISRPLTYWRNAAVDPRLIPLGSRIFIPAYCRTPSRGWFVARDTGGAIIARHVDVFRAPPERLERRSLRGQKIYVVPPGFRVRGRAGARCPR